MQVRPHVDAGTEAVVHSFAHSPRRLLPKSAVPTPKKLHGNGRIRVLHLVDTLNMGGTESQMVQAALRLHARHHEVTVGCLRAEGPLLELLQLAGIPVVEFRKEKTLLSPSGVYQLLRLAVFLRRKKFHVVHAHDVWSNLLGVPAAWLSRTPVILASRRYLVDLDWYRPWKRKVIQLIYRLATHVVVNSTSVYEKLRESHSLHAEKVRVIYNGIDVERFSTAQRDRERLLPGVGKSAKLIAVVANMYSPVKGHVHLISAARHVCSVVPEATFLLIGDGRERAQLERRAKEAGLQKNVLFLGGRNDVPELLACCDLFVLPSEAEALPNALLEAMAAGLAVVATGAGGSAEIIEDGVNGLLVPPCDGLAMAAAILRILEDPNLACRLACAGQEHIRTSFSFDCLIARLEQLYQEAS